MSADRYTYCPRCSERLKQALERQQRELDESYGNVPAAEFAERYNRLHGPAPGLQQTLREDFEVGIGLGGASTELGLTVSYAASCSECGLRLSLQRTIPWDKLEGRGEGDVQGG